METKEIKDGAQTVGELVAEDYRKAEVFKKYGIDFCCGGKKPLGTICDEKGIDIAEINTALAQLDKSTDVEHDFNSMPLDNLVDHIINTHHKYVEAAIPLLKEFSDKVAKVHGQANPEVVEINHHYHSVAGELTTHMKKEELILFPRIMKMVQAQRNGDELVPPTFGTIANPINMMEAEHDSAGDAMASIKELSGNYTPPEHACNTYRVLYAKLQEFENDLHQHIHLENNILFPKAIAMEQELLR